MKGESTQSAQPDQFFEKREIELTGTAPLVGVSDRCVEHRGNGRISTAQPQRAQDFTYNPLFQDTLGGEKYKNSQNQA
jgi:hypothetical protein